MTDLLEKKGVLSWFANNHVAANLLMMMILVGGVISLFMVTIEIFPDTSADIIQVSVPYLGASPDEVEQGVILRVEEAVAGIEGIKRLRSTASEGTGVVSIEVEDYADPQDVLDDVKAEVDRIITFPEETEKPVIAELTLRRGVMNLVLYGDVGERTLKTVAERMRDELTAMDNISQVDISGARNYEISIEVSEQTLRRYGLSFEQVSDVVRRSSLDLPGGSVKTAGGEILIRTKGQRYYGPEFEEIVVLTRPDGTEIRLGDIAKVRDAFEDSDILSRFDGQRAVMLQIYRIGKQDVLSIAKKVREYLDEQKGRLPAGINTAIWFDRSGFLRDRMQLLEKNAILGLVLVFVCLSFFLDLRLAFWVTMGIPISFMGAFWLMPYLGVTLNMISLFAFILALGIVVDDAIVIGENIFAYRQQGLSSAQAAVKGVREMAIPVTLAVLTTVFAFMPLFFVSGIFGKFIKAVPFIVISVLMFSLVEALLILPAHLSASLRKSSRRDKHFIDRFQMRVRDGLERFVNSSFSTAVDKAVKYRYITISLGIAMLVIAVGLVRGGRIKVRMFPDVNADNVWVSLSMPQGTSVDQTERIVEYIENAAYDAEEKLIAQIPKAKRLIVHMSTTIGQQPFGNRRNVSGGGGGSHLAEVNIELPSGDKRKISSGIFAKAWREEVGEIPGVSSITYTSSLFSSPDAISVELSHQSFDKLLSASERLKELLGEFAGVIDIDDSFEPGKIELKLSLTREGRMLNLTLADLARQVRYGFYGAESQRIQRGRDDVRVMVRYPESERNSIADIRNMRIRLADGTEIPFSTVADVQTGRGYANIQRSERRRIVRVTADVDESSNTTANEINMQLAQKVLPSLNSEFPGLMYSFEGEQREQKDIAVSLGSGAGIALLAIFAILAVQFRSYSQPSIIMSAIPFGLVGAVFGHVVMGFNLSILSFFGIVALTGIVVNDSLIMIDLINRRRKEGGALLDIVRESATRRFRPIMLTTLTTFFGLTPMLLERSLQARFLIPMAISLGFGVLFATCITLFLVPALYVALEDIQRMLGITPVHANED